MTASCRQVLINLRCEINLIRDSSFSMVRDAAIRMLSLIDTELSRISYAGPSQAEVQNIEAALNKLPNALLLREITRRMQAIRHVRKLCFRCKQNPARARGLCKRCYKKAYRRGEIKNAKG